MFSALSIDFLEPTTELLSYYIDILYFHHKGEYNLHININMYEYKHTNIYTNIKYGN